MVDDEVTSCVLLMPQVAKLCKLFTDKMIVKKSSFATAARYRPQAFSMMNFFGLFLQLFYVYRVRLFYVFLGVNVSVLGNTVKQSCFLILC